MRDNINDKIYTPSFIVTEVLDFIAPKILKGSTVIEPFKGKGAFYKQFDKYFDTKTWCEIDEGVDYLSEKGKWTWLITNPPYSTFKLMLPKMLSDADNIVLVIPLNKLLSSMPRLMDIKRAGCGIHSVHYLGSGRQLGFPFGFPVGVVYIKKGYKGTAISTTYAARCYKAKAK